jgi:S1-C subfamily serine protease
MNEVHGVPARRESQRGFGAQPMKPTISTFKIAATSLLASALFFTDRPALAVDTKPNAVENSVVQVFSSVRYPDLAKPWTKRSPAEMTASGVVIEGKRILCNAHAVLYASQVQVQGNQAGDKISASAEAVAPGIDLAVLKLEDEAFFDTHPPLPRAQTLPEIRDVVMAYGYPDGGSSLSTTKGIVSRIEFAHYNSAVWGLWIQIDAAINPGNSGGPAMVGEKMIGLTFSRLGGSDNIGFIIPNEEIDLFLQDIADGRYDGKPTMLDENQTLENPALRAFLRLEKSAEGMVVHEPNGHEPDYPLKKWDLITRIGDAALDNQGRIKLADSNLRINFRYLIQKIAKHGKVPLTVVRSGKALQIELPVPSAYPLVIPSLEGADPSYFIYGPMAFSSASVELVGDLPRSEPGARMLGMLIASGSPLMRRFGDKPAFAGERLVFVSSPFFPSKLVQGYDNPAARVVKTVNDVAIKNLGHLVEVLRDCRKEFIAIEFDVRGGEALVFRRDEMLAATDDILTDNGVRSRGSADMLAIWNAKPHGGAAE